MKQGNHAWVAFRALKLIEDNGKAKGLAELELLAELKLCVRHLGWGMIT